MAHILCDFMRYYLLVIIVIMIYVKPQNFPKYFFDDVQLFVFVHVFIYIVVYFGVKYCVEVISLPDCMNN